MCFNPLVYWQLICVLMLLFSISCMLLVNWLAGVFMRARAGEAALCIPPSSRSLHAWGPDQSGGAGPWPNTLEKPEVIQGRKGWSAERQADGWGGLWAREGGLHPRNKWFVCCTTFPHLAYSLLCANKRKTSWYQALDLPTPTRSFTCNIFLSLTATYCGGIVYRSWGKEYNSQLAFIVLNLSYAFYKISRFFSWSRFVFFHLTWRWNQKISQQILRVMLRLCVSFLLFKIMTRASHNGLTLYSF